LQHRLLTARQAAQQEARLVANPALANPTIVVITDRNDLDDQLFGTFSLCQSLLRQTPRQADSRDELKQLLSRPSGGVILTTIQKFSPTKGEDYPLLTDRRNVIVIADEAGVIKIVMTGSAADPPEWQTHLANKGGGKRAAICSPSVPAIPMLR
jgi:hypothetical protein